MDLLEHVIVFNGLSTVTNVASKGASPVFVVGDLCLCNVEKLLIEEDEEERREECPCQLRRVFTLPSFVSLTLNESLSVREPVMLT